MNTTKKLSILLLLALGVGGSARAVDSHDGDSDCGDNFGAKTYFKPRPITTRKLYQNALTWHHQYHYANDCWVNYTSNFIYEKSRRRHRNNDGCDSGCVPAATTTGTTTGAVFEGGSSAASFFLPGGKSVIRVREDGSGDVQANWFGLGNPNGGFSSDFSIRPERRVFAWHNHFHFNLDNWLCGLWAEIDFAVVRAKHNLNCCENVIRQGTVCGLANFTQAISRVGLPLGTTTTTTSATGCSGDCDSTTAGTFSRFNCFDCHHTGVDDIEFKLGYNWYYCEDDHVGIYIAATAPTGRRVRNHFVFEPVVGTRQGSVGFGVTGDYTFWANDDCNLSIATDFEYRFGFSGRECHSFDLKTNGEWSRYLLVVTQAQPFNPQPAINFLTTSVRVETRNTIDWWLALNYEWCGWDFELGYELWWRDCERLKNRDGDCSGLGTSGIGGCDDNSNGRCCPATQFAQLGTVGIFDIARQCDAATTASTATIAQGRGPTNAAKSDATFTPLALSNVNFSSALQPRALTNTLYGAIGYCMDVCDFPVNLGFGASVEWATRTGNRSGGCPTAVTTTTTGTTTTPTAINVGRRKGALDTWSVFGKLTLSF